ncbi:hypothetical protein C8T65DRAFT_585555 [Cerioporus squamosus]|nr:hypothetical protein C8T65DRAFT_585555 [Cerioporus squamosus]
MSSTSNVPVEICQHIIDALWDDIGTLRQCALACRAWLPRSRLHIFHSITLRERPNVYAFASVMQRERSIEQLVQRIRIDLEKHTFLLDSFFAVLGHRLPRLRELSLTGNMFPGLFHRHITRRTCLHASFMASITSLSLYKVTFLTFGDLARLLDTLTHCLTHLTLDSTSWITYGTYSSELITSRSLKLETFHVCVLC